EFPEYEIDNLIGFASGSLENRGARDNGTNRFEHSFGPPARGHGVCHQFERGFAVRKLTRPPSRAFSILADDNHRNRQWFDSASSAKRLDFISLGLSIPLLSNTKSPGVLVDPSSYIEYGILV